LNQKKNFWTNFILDATFVGCQYPEVLQNIVEPLSLKDCINATKNDIIYVIHYPSGKDKHQSNHVICKLDNNSFAYRAETNAGSSGAPVFCGEFLVGLHKKSTYLMNDNVIKKECNWASKMTKILEVILKEAPFDVEAISIEITNINSSINNAISQQNDQNLKRLRDRLSVKKRDFQEAKRLLKTRKSSILCKLELQNKIRELQLKIAKISFEQNNDCSIKLQKKLQMKKHELHTKTKLVPKLQQCEIELQIIEGLMIKASVRGDSESVKNFQTLWKSKKNERDALQKYIIGSNS